MQVESVKSKEVWLTSVNYIGEFKGGMASKEVWFTSLDMQISVQLLDVQYYVQQCDMHCWLAIACDCHYHDEKAQIHNNLRYALM